MVLCTGRGVLDAEALELGPVVGLEREPYGRISGTSPRTANSLSKRLTPGDAMANQPSRGEIAAGLVSDSSPRALFSCNDLRFFGSPLYEACVQ